MKTLGRLFASCAVLAAAVMTVRANPVTGVYRITTQAQPALALDVAGFGNANGTTVQLYTASHTSSQQWRVEQQADLSYKIYAYSGLNSLQMLDLTNGTTATGTAVKTYEDNGNAAQLWYFKPASGGYYRLIPKNAGVSSAQTLDAGAGNGGAVGSTTSIQPFTNSGSQLFHLDWSGPAQVRANLKKGIGGRENETPGLGCGWFYTWGGDRPADTPKNVEFDPMEWGYYGNANNDNVNWLNGRKAQPGVHIFMGYNEPDSSSQANLSVASALEGWQYLNALGIPLISPGAVHADDQWMKDFMAGAKQKGYRVDAVAIHWYGGNDPTGFLNYVDSIHNLYGKPVWITEFCPADWSGSHGISAGDEAWFMRQVIPQLNSRSYVQRYAWYTGDTPQSNGTLSTAGLVNDDGTLSDLGRLYARL